jgi:hypothetical protein
VRISETREKMNYHNQAGARRHTANADLRTGNDCPL